MSHAAPNLQHFFFSPKKPKVLHFSPSSNVIYLSFGLRPEHPRRCCSGAPSHSGCDEKLLSRLSSSLKSTKPSPVDFDCTPALSHSCHMCGSYKSAVISLAPLQYTACVAPTLSLAISCAYCPAMATLSEGTTAQHCYSIGRTKPFFFFQKLCQCSSETQELSFTLLECVLVPPPELPSSADCLWVKDCTIRPY